jgi:hypothetical protein
MPIRLAAWALAAALSAASAEPVPEARQADLLLKVLTADRNFMARSRGGPTIGVLYERSSRFSRDAAERFAAEVRRLESSGETPARVALVDISVPDSLEAGIAASGADALWVAPLGHPDVARIARLARTRKIRTAAGLTAYVDAGLAVGFEPERGAARVVVNVEAARAEGADFSSKLLRLARRVP